MVDADTANVSIHAPTRGATIGEFLAVLILGAFQSTHPRGVRLWWPVCVTRPTCSFNPRTHAGCDGGQTITVGDTGVVSIHAPTRGATRPAATSINTTTFQSTHPRGVRLATPDIVLSDIGFNPRTHAGCDLHNSCHKGRDERVSIHAPTRGATHPLRYSGHQPRVSIHAPTRGATRRQPVQSNR